VSFKPTGPTKRQKELVRAERQKAKQERREQRRREKEERAQRPSAPGEDPDLAGIVPGPQPPPET
jgi:hypothetical protein